MLPFGVTTACFVEGEGSLPPASSDYRNHVETNPRNQLKTIPATFSRADVFPGRRFALTRATMRKAFSLQ